MTEWSLSMFILLIIQSSLFRFSFFFSFTFNLCLSLQDSSIYAHYVFKAFDVNCTGAISFRVNIYCFTSNRSQDLWQLASKRQFVFVFYTQQFKNKHLTNLTFNGISVNRYILILAKRLSKIASMHEGLQPAGWKAKKPIEECFAGKGQNMALSKGGGAVKLNWDLHL